VPVLLGANEYGQPVTVDFAQRVHLIVQGRTGSGKSRLSYGLRQQLAAPECGHLIWPRRRPESA
jgi:hypothetical protein